MDTPARLWNCRSESQRHGASRPVWSVEPEGLRPSARCRLHTNIGIALILSHTVQFSTVGRNEAARAVPEQRKRPGLIPAPKLYLDTFRSRSGQDFFYDPAVNVGQSVVSSSVPVRQFLVIDSELVQDRGVEIVQVNFAGDRQETEVVGFAIDQSRLDSSAGEDGAETLLLMFASVFPDRGGPR